MISSSGLSARGLRRRVEMNEMWVELTMDGIISGAMYQKRELVVDDVGINQLITSSIILSFICYLPFANNWSK